METPIIATTTPQAVAHAYIIEPSRPAYATYSRLQGAELARAFREKTGRRSATDAEEMKMSSSNSLENLFQSPGGSGSSVSSHESDQILLPLDNNPLSFSTEEKIKLQAKVLGLEKRMENMATSHAERTAAFEKSLEEMQAQLAAQLNQPRPKSILSAPIALLDGVTLTAKKCVTYSNLMAENYPKVCKKAMGQVVTDLRAGKFKPTSLLEEWQPLEFAGSQKSPGKYGHYAAQAVFRSRFDDREKLRQCMVELGAEMDIPKEVLHIEFDDEISPAAYSEDNSAQASNHYLFSEKKDYNFKKHAGRFAKYMAAMHVFENVDEATGEATTVMWLYLPGKKWDGTSCFNFMKEIIGRYHGETNPNVTKAAELLTLTDEASRALNSPLHILRFILLLPFALLLNLSATMWEKAEAKHEPQKLASSGDREMSFLNLTAKESKAMCAAFKASGVPPTAGIIYVVTEAYRRAVGCYPFGINLQASLQTRAFTPVLKERYLIGDWLVGPCYKVRSLGRALMAALGQGEKQYFKVEDSKALYKQLINDVQTNTGRVREAFIAREYGVIKGGPAPYQNQDLYADINRMNDSILFNNYGPRFMHPDSQLVSWNWTGPGKLDCNTISVNGCTSITLASTLMGMDKVTQIRDDVKAMIDEYSQAGRVQ